MVIGPPIVWLGAAGLAGLLARGPIWTPAPYAVAGLIVALGAVSYRNGAVRIAQGQKVREMRAAALPAAIAAAKARAVPAPSPDEAELTPEQLASQRYALDRALQPLDQWNGFDKIDEFQTAGRRYQINAFSYALGTAQTHYTPSFHGYLSQAQRQLIDRYRLPEVWKYWVYETAWGHLNLTNFDPAGKDNIMLTGFYGQAVCLYMSATGDRRYAEPGSLPFQLNEQTTYAHDAHTLARSVIGNFRASPFCLYPCEPNWVYPICNHNGMVSLAIYDRLFGADYVEEIRERWLHALDSELTGPDGGVIGLRSTYTGLEFKFPSGEAGYALPTNTFMPERAWRMWATARSDLQHLLSNGPDGRKVLTLPGRGFDVGNYRPAKGPGYAGIANTAREFGDEELAQAALDGLDREGGRLDEGGVLRYVKMSNLSNAQAVQAHLRRKDHWRDAIAKGPPASVFKGPLLADAAYPEVLVARAFSNGENTRYVVRGSEADSAEVTADARGHGALTLVLEGRTAFELRPAA
jgi:hypothetical protein